MQKEFIVKNPLLKLSFEFSLLVLEYCDLLDILHKYSISKQLVRSGTSIGANSMEAQNAESKADFIHKIKIAAKEADETQYWITLCEFAKGYPDAAIIANKLTELQKIINAILGTAKRKTPFSYFLSFFIF
ncbi:MAG: four helix bundle protein [Ferruginibacter sp.]